MSTAVVLRRACGADLPALLPLCAEHAAYEGLAHDATTHHANLVAALDASPPLLYAWLASVDQQAVGYASATLDFSTLDRASFLHLDCLYVCEGWRGHAIGLRLWQAAHALAAQLGCRQMQWQTPDWNVAAARFYRRLGAQETAKRRYTLALECQAQSPEPARSVDPAFNANGTCQRAD
ncbi:GNAT family N-acetyltransferase [Dyella silvatica]|uniref:GNAT family N-acetyltransferase n=1 Tax=Dyella silvatica TaxID=2992128 RepID=UPI00224CF899|nr:GNAT family N-acetyltransferase [Dyella silvatica]